MILPHWSCIRVTNYEQTAPVLKAWLDAVPVQSRFHNKESA
jgi:hypothetical protein